MLIDPLDDLLSSLGGGDDDNKDENDDDLLSSLLGGSDDTEDDDEDGLLSSLFGGGDDEDDANEDDDDGLLSSLLGGDDEDDDPEDEDDILGGLLGDDEDEDDEIEDDDGEEEDSDGSIMGSIFSAFGMGGDDKEGDNGDLELADVAYKYEKRLARLDITQNSKTDHRSPKRYTIKELQTQIKKDYKYMKGKSYFMIQPFIMMVDYPYKKSSKDSDTVTTSNVIYDYAFVIGRLRRWNSTEEYKNKKSYIMGDVMLVKKGYYYVDGKTEPELLLPHFALVFKKKREKKKIKSKRFRDVLVPLKQVLRSGKPYGIYKEFPKLHKLIT